MPVGDDKKEALTPVPCKYRNILSSMAGAPAAATSGRLGEPSLPLYLLSLGIGMTEKSPLKNRKSKIK
jgi:hypothetical protein